MFSVHAAEVLNLSAVKDAFKQLRVLPIVSLADLAARLEPGDPLAAEASASAADRQQQAICAEGGR